VIGESPQTIISGAWAVETKWLKAPTSLRTPTASKDSSIKTKSVTEYEEKH